MALAISTNNAVEQGISMTEFSNSSCSVHGWLRSRSYPPWSFEGLRFDARDLVRPVLMTLLLARDLTVFAAIWEQPVQHQIIHWFPLCRHEFGSDLCSSPISVDCDGIGHGRQFCLTTICFELHGKKTGQWPFATALMGIF